jgi:hypothetical protein
MSLPSSPRLPAYALPGVEPLRTSQHGQQLDYRGDQLVTLPSVAAALARAPEVFLAVADPDADLQENALPREVLCRVLDLGSRDGLEWELGLGDEVKSIVDTGCDLVSEDLLEQALAAQPDVNDAYHVDREVFNVRLTRLARADEMFARYLDAVTAAHRELARLRGIELPY